MTYFIFLAELMLKSLLVLGVASLVTTCLRSASAAARHFVWVTAFCILLALPIASLLVPSHSAVSIPIEGVSDVRPREMPGISASQLNAVRMDLPGDSSLVSMATPLPQAPSPKDPATGYPLRMASIILVGGWGLGIAFFVLQNAYRIRLLRLTGQKAIRIPYFDAATVDQGQLSRRIGLNRTWDLRQSVGSQPPSAMTWGFMTPIVLMPCESRAWPSERLEAVLLHELAHVQRMDSLTQLISVVACSLYWINPTVWLCARAMRAEAETAADDTVIRMGVRPSTYAQELLRMASELGHRRHPFSPLGVPAMKESKIESRLKAILNSSARKRQGVSTIEALSVVTVAFSVLLGLGSIRTNLVPLAPIGNSPTNSLRQESQQEITAKNKKDKAAKAEMKALGLAERQIASQKNLVSKQMTLAKKQRQLEEKWIKQSANEDKVRALNLAKTAAKVKVSTGEVSQLDRQRAKIVEEMKIALKMKEMAGSKKATADQTKRNAERRADLTGDVSQLVRQRAKIVEEMKVALKMKEMAGSKTATADQAKRNAEGRADLILELKRATENSQKAAEVQMESERIRAQGAARQDRLLSEGTRLRDALNVQAERNKRIELNRAIEQLMTRSQLDSQVRKAKMEMELAAIMHQKVEAIRKTGSMSGDQLMKAQTALKLAEEQIALVRKILAKIKSN